MLAAHVIGAAKIIVVLITWEDEVLKRRSLIGLTLFSMFFPTGMSARTRMEPQAATIRIIANSQTIPEGQNISITQGQSIQLTVLLVNPDNSVTDITNSAETSICALTPWNIALSSLAKGQVLALIDPSYGVTLSQSSSGAVAVEYFAGDNETIPTRTVLFNISSGANVTAPNHLAAATASTSQVNLTWNASMGTLQNYQIERSTSIAGTFTSVGTSTTNSFTDNSAAANNAYIYRVKAIDTSNASSPASNMDLAVVWAYTDPSIVAGTTPIRADHINNLRNATDAARAAVGLSAYGWTDTISSVVLIKAQHITELRTAVNQALAVLNISTPSYTDPDPTLTVGTPIRAAHITDLRNALK